jgi:hypothetical protein
MKTIISFLLLLMSFQISHAANDQKITPEQCQAASTEIIRISEEALKVTESKKNVKKLTSLVAKWKGQLNSDKDACDVYQDILKASRSF